MRAGFVSVVFALLFLLIPHDAGAAGFIATGSMNTARHDHTATLLPSGRVLVVGGFGSLASTEIYDPATGVWTEIGRAHV